jgi:hypothetical protein
VATRRQPPRPGPGPGGIKGHGHHDRAGQLSEVPTPSQSPTRSPLKSESLATVT